MLSRILQLQQRGSWSVFDGKCVITHHHPPGLGSLELSSLSSYETVVGGQPFGTMSCRPAQSGSDTQSSGKKLSSITLTKTVVSMFIVSINIYISTSWNIKRLWQDAAAWIDLEWGWQIRIHPLCTRRDFACEVSRCGSVEVQYCLTLKCMSHPQVCT